MTWFKPRDLLDRTFEISIIAKGLDGLLELIGGMLLLAVGPSTINHLIVDITQHELSEDPHDLIATRLLHFGAGLTGRPLRGRLPARARHRQGRARGRTAAQQAVGLSVADRHAGHLHRVSALPHRPHADGLARLPDDLRCVCGVADLARMAQAAAQTRARIQTMTNRQAHHGWQTPLPDLSSPSSVLTTNDSHVGECFSGRPDHVGTAMMPVWIPGLG